MSDFKFACPGCGQRILANDDYVGRQINCPACQTAITVPANPSAPPVPPHVAKVAVSSLSAAPPQTPLAVPTPEEQGSAVYQAHMARQPKKSYSGLIAGVAVVALLGLSAFFSRGWLAAKWRAFHEPAAADIWQKVITTYQGLRSLSVTGTGDLEIETLQSSAATNTASIRRTRSSDLTMKLGRPDNFRLDVHMRPGMDDTRVIAWSTGLGYYRMINNDRFNEPSRNIALDSSGPAGIAMLAGLFYDGAGGAPAYNAANWSKTYGAEIPGQSCYVLAGKIPLQSMLL
jgi:hypothetical protein